MKVGKIGGKNRPSLLAQETSVEKKPKTSSVARGGSPAAQEMPAEKKPKISFAACEDSPTASKFVIDLTFSKGEKEEAVRSMPVESAIPKATNLHKGLPSIKVPMCLQCQNLCQSVHLELSLVHLWRSLLL